MITSVGICAVSALSERRESRARSDCRDPTIGPYDVTWAVATLLSPPVARAEMTRRLAHGDRYLETRLFLADGRVIEQVNPGLAELEQRWREVGRFADLSEALNELQGSGWTVREASVLGFDPIRMLVFLVFVTTAAPLASVFVGPLAFALVAPPVAVTLVRSFGWIRARTKLFRDH